jgi:BppA domain 1
MKNITKIALAALMLSTIAFAGLADDNKKSENLVTKLSLYNRKKPLTTVIQDDKVIVVENKTLKDIGGVIQQIKLNQTEIKPIFFSAESKAENVSGTSNSAYSIYLDLTHTDGTRKYGVIAKFKTGTHDWETVTKSYTPKKPIKTISFHLLFRKHTGKVWFRNIVLIEDVKK